MYHQIHFEFQTWLAEKNLLKKKGGLKKYTCSFVFVAGFPEIHKYQSKSIQHHPSIPGPFFDFPPFGLRPSAHPSAEINTLFARTTLWVFEWIWKNLIQLQIIFYSFLMHFICLVLQVVVSQFHAKKLVSLLTAWQVRRRPVISIHLLNALLPFHPEKSLSEKQMTFWEEVSPATKGGRVSSRWFQVGKCRRLN